jgi:hypothetical protein
LLTWRYGGAAALLAAIAIVGLAGCGSIPFFGNKPAQPGVAGGPGGCPVAVILRPLANTVVFAGPGDLKPLNASFYGVYSDISATCQASGDALHVALDNIIVAERGPATRGNDVDFTYFVALTASDQTILGKKLFGVHVTVPDKAKRAGVNDHVEVVFNLAGRPISDLNISVGFQESPDAVEFYKNYRGR